MSFHGNFENWIEAKATQMRSEMLRLNGLPDRWLARELMTITRAARHVGGHILSPQNDVDLRLRSLLWDVIPEVAFRLGETEFLPGERSHAVSGLTDTNLRTYSADLLSDRPYLVAFARRPWRGMNVYAFITRPAHDGNPVVIGLDRFADPDPDFPDKAAASINRRFEAEGIEGVWTWSPPSDIRLATAIHENSNPTRDLSP